MVLVEPLAEAVLHPHLGRLLQFPVLHLRVVALAVTITTNIQRYLVALAAAAHPLELAQVAHLGRAITAALALVVGVAAAVAVQATQGVAQ